MTKSTITRERLEWLSQISCRDDIEDIGGDEIRELASMALAAMDREPVAWREPFTGRCVSSIFYQDGSSPLDHGYEPLYAAPPEPVVPDGYVMVTKEPTEAMLTASYMFAHVDATRESWSAMLAAAPQSPGSEPATVPGKWIPVSERIPDNTEPVLCIEKRADFGTYGQPFVCWHDGGGWVGKTNYRPIVTHWMPLPAAPQEVKSE
ncbi:DUF551 domain-containing protein [Klebsiella pneumoniae]|nr:DUF551 domain-containing protein [Klebsiella pneumoniae]MDA5066508.1 DUF551 domain-containing protein [Klebsiella pneumoniae]